MKNTKLWSVLLVSVLLCACVLGTLFYGVAADGSTETYTVGEDYDSIKAALEAAAGKNWPAGSELVIEFTGTDSTALVTAPNADESEYLLFGRTTIFRDDNTRLPITIKGTASSVESNEISFDHGASEDSIKSFAAANDYTFENVYLPLAGVLENRYANLYAGSGRLEFVKCLFRADGDFWAKTSKGAASVSGSYSYTVNLSADNFTMDAFYGWGEAQIQANQNEAGLIRSEILFGEDTVFFPGSQGSSLAAVRYKPANWSIDVSEAEGVAEKAAAAKEQAKNYSFEAGTLTGECAVKPCDTEAGLVVDNKLAIRGGDGELLSSNSTTGHGVGCLRGRVGTSPVAKMTLEVKSGIVGRVMTDDHVVENVPRVGDNEVTVSGGSVGAGGNGVCMRLLVTPLYGDMTVKISETTAEETNIAWFQGSNDATYTALYGTYDFTITGGHIGSGGNGYFGLNAGLGCINRFLGGNISGCCYGFRYAMKVAGNVPAEKIPEAYREYLDGEVEVYNEYGGTTIECAVYGSRISSGSRGNTFNVVNEGATFKNMFSGGEYATGTSTGQVTNLVRGGNFYVFSGGYASATAKVVNYIEGGEYSYNDDGFSAYLGTYTGSSSHVSEGMENYISGGNFTGYILCGIRNKEATLKNTNKDPQGNALPAIYTEISGGIFSGVWGTSGNVTGDVVTNITGGSFYPYNMEYDRYPNGFIGGLRNSGSHTTGNLTTNISGGEFFTRVIGATNWSTAPAALNAGKVSLNISGGIFHDEVFTNSIRGNEVAHYGEAEIKIDLTQNDVTFLAPVGNAALVATGYDPVETDTLTIIGGEKEILLGKNAELAANSVTGTVKLKQIEGWLAHDYFTAPAGTVVTVAEAAGVFGEFVQDDSVLVTGVPSNPFAATIRLDERVGIRVLFEKAAVEEYGENFSFKVTMPVGEETIVLAQGGYADLVDYEGYASFIVSGIGLKDFNTDIDVEGSTFRAFQTSVCALAATAEEEWTAAELKEWKEFAGAILEFHNVYVLGNEGTKTPEAVSKTCQHTWGEAEAKNAYVSVLMADAVGLRIGVTFEQKPTNAAIKVGEEVLTNAFTFGEPDPDSGAVTGTVDLYFNHKYLASDFSFDVVSDAGTHLTYSGTMEALVYALTQQTENQYKANATALLYYIQQAVDCIA